MAPIVSHDGRLTTPTTGLDIHYRDWDAAGTNAAKRTPALLLHGLASTCTIYDLCAPLLARTRRVVAYDQRGHGLTAKPEGGYDFPTFVADGVGLAHALRIEPPYLVVGHSWGASVALHWAMLRPELVSAVVLVDGVFVPSAGSIRARLPRDQHMRILRTLWDNDVDAAIAAHRRPALALLAERTPGDDEVLRLQEARRQRLQRAQPLLSFRWLADTIHDVPLQRPEVLAEAIDAVDP